MVHTFTMNGLNFAVDGNSGSIHMLDDLSCQLLSGMQELIPLGNIKECPGLTKYSEKEIKEAYNEIKLLKEQGLFFQLMKALRK